jgi:hypothetical protein
MPLPASLTFSGTSERTGGVRSMLKDAGAKLEQNLSDSFKMASNINLVP